MIFREAQEMDDEQLTRLFSKPMPGDLSLSLTRTPSYLKSCRLLGPSRRVLTAVEKQDVLALCSFFSWPYRLNNEIRNLWTIADFRADDRAAHRSVTGRGWIALRKLLDDNPALISVVSDNPISKRLFSKKRRGWPTLRPVARLQTLMFPLLGSASLVSGLVQPKVSALCSFLNRQNETRQFAPVFCDEHFGTVLPRGEDFLAVTDGARILACGTLWNPERFRQTRVAGYRGHYAKLFQWSSRFKMGVLPNPNSIVPIGFAAFLRGSDQQALALVAKGLASRAKEQGLSFLVWGGDAQESAPFPRHWFRFTYPSELFQLVWDGDSPLVPSEAFCGYEVSWL